MNELTLFSCKDPNQHVILPLNTVISCFRHNVLLVLVTSSALLIISEQRPSPLCSFQESVPNLDYLNGSKIDPIAFWDMEEAKQMLFS